MDDQNKMQKDELTEQELEQVSGGKPVQQMQDMTNNLATTGAKAAALNDQYLRG